MENLQSGIKDKYEEVGKFHLGFARVKLNGKYGYINENYEEICPIKYDMTIQFFGPLAPVKQNGKVGLINQKGEEICPVIYDRHEPYNMEKGLYLMILKDEYYLINKNGEKINSTPYNRVSPFVKGRALVKANGKYAYINKDFQEISPFKYSDITFKLHMLHLKIKGFWDYHFGDSSSD